MDMSMHGHIYTYMWVCIGEGIYGGMYIYECIHLCVNIFMLE